MSLTRQIARNTTVQLLGKALSTLLGLGSVMIMTRALGVEQFGWYVTAVGFLQFIGILSDFGFTITTSSMLAEPRFDKNKLLHTIFTWRFFTALIFNGLAPLIILFFPYSAEIKTAVAILSLSFFAIALNQVFTGYYQYKLKMHIQTAGDLIGRALLLAGVACFAYWRIGFLPMMWAVAIGSAANCLFLWMNSGGIKFSLNKEISRALLKKIWPVAVAVIFNAFYLQGDRVILPLYVSETEVGLYGAAYRVLDIVAQISAMAMGIMLPLIAYSWSRQEHSEFKKRAQMGFELVALILLPLVTGAIVLAKPIMLFVAGEEFASAGPILALLILAALGITLGMVFGHISLAINKQRQVLWVYISDAILSVAGYFFFIPRFGLYGAVYVTVFSEFYAGFMLLIMSSYYSRFFPGLTNFFKIILASLVMGFVIYLLPPLHIIPSILIGGIIYALLIFILRVVSKQTILEILRPRRNIVVENKENW